MYIVVFLLVVVALSLLSVKEELELQRTPEQISKIAKQEKAEAELKAFMEHQQKEKELELVALPWAEVDSIQQAVSKFIAEGYMKYVVIFVLLITVRAIYRNKENQY